MISKIIPRLIVISLCLNIGFAYSQALSGLSRPPDIGGGTTSIGFETLPIGQEAASFTVNGVVFEGIGGDLRIKNNYAGNYNTSSGGNYLDNKPEAGTTNGIKVTFGSSVEKFAFNFGATDLTWTLKAYNSENSLLSTSTLPVLAGGNAGDYFGVEALNIKYFTIEASGSDDWVFFDNLVYSFFGPSSADTQASLEQSAQRLRGVYNLQSTALVNGLTYDCRLFDIKNICLSTGGRYSNNHGASGYTTSALLIGAYRLNKNIRLGAWVDQNLSTNTVTGINLSNSKPLFGAFGAWAETPSGEGYEVKVSAGYGDKDLTVTRDVVGTSEAGFGSTRLNSQAISTVSSFGFKLNNDVLASPYVGVQYSRVASSGYTEAFTSGVTAPLTYGRLSQENVSILAGLKLSARLDPKTALFGSVGVEQNVNNKSGQYSATGVDGLTAVDFNSNVQKTRATASAGFSYDIDKKQRVSLSGIYREEAFNPTATTSVFATYTVGL